MARHGKTPKSVLDAPRLTPVLVHRTYVKTKARKGTARMIRDTFVGDVERDLLGVTVGTSRKGRKIRRAAR